MPNNFYLDKENEDQEMVRKVVRNVKPKRSSSKTVRYHSGGYVFKTSEAQNTDLSPKVAARNTELLNELGIPFPSGSGGLYDLKDLGFYKRTPVVRQEAVDKTFSRTLEGKEITDETKKFISRMVKHIDRAYEAGVKLDTSMTNFGFMGKNVVFLDYQDKQSIDTDPSDRDLIKMYNSFITGSHELNISKEEMARFISSNSEVGQKPWST